MKKMKNKCFKIDSIQNILIFFKLFYKPIKQKENYTIEAHPNEIAQDPIDSRNPEKKSQHYYVVHSRKNNFFINW